MSEHDEARIRRLYAEWLAEGGHEGDRESVRTLLRTCFGGDWRDGPRFGPRHAWGLSYYSVADVARQADGRFAILTATGAPSDMSLLTALLALAAADVPVVGDGGVSNEVGPARLDADDHARDLNVIGDALGLSGADCDDFRAILSRAVAMRRFVAAADAYRQWRGGRTDEYSAFGVAGPTREYDAARAAVEGVGNATM